MTTKNRLAQLEKQKPQAKATRHEFTAANNEAHERSMNTLADALADMFGVPVTRAEVDQVLKELNQ